MQQIHRDMLTYEIEGGAILRIDDPKVDGKLPSDTLLNWIAPGSSEPEARTSYLFVVPLKGGLGTLDPRAPIMIENPDVIDRPQLNVCFGDNHAEALDRKEALQLLRNAQPRVFYGNGDRWKAR